MLHQNARLEAATAAGMKPPESVLAFHRVIIIFYDERDLPLHAAAEFMARPIIVKELERAVRIHWPGRAESARVYGRRGEPVIAQFESRP